MNITKATREYIDQHPSIKDCLKKGIVNYSALARHIADELGVSKKRNFDAILVASRRHARKLRHVEQEKKVLGLLKRSKVHIKTKICRLALEKNYYTFSGLAKLAKLLEEKHLFQVVEGESAITLIIEEESLEKAKDVLEGNIINTKNNLAEIIIISPREAEITVGVTAYLSSLLSDNGINVISTMGSYKDDIFVVESKDISKVLEIFGKF
ncbi:MAG: ACT domain-containing protein [Candidatus Aenigmatarchaeota archaeon]